ncbi:hypothetical protein [Achromobacter xylosoxidans]|uniref:hypothetical protein n=1 Tax=Alcaligenes xylosoxydans xylosoxydans TaxID=85698 RepID=UPI000332350A|nr:hypothetical protein [Achromobacter xylosoxidans]QKI79122.1 hypothetical protein HPS43_29015 [Achromobacter xylosoxidans]CCH09499.1 hypothetical protein NH44784_055561 [Achromobacter xylosoxidans NH44784-1996]
MQSNLILTTAQAQAVYSAMCALDALGPDHGAEFHLGDWVYVRRVHLDGAIRIEDRADGDDERHDDLAAFAAAYGLRQPPDAAPLLEALQAALAYNDSVMSADGSGQFSWGPIARAAIAQATA